MGRKTELSLGHIHLPCTTRPLSVSENGAAKSEFGWHGNLSGALVLEVMLLVLIPLSKLIDTCGLENSLPPLAVP